jgi:hypothetical protein
MKAQTPDEVAAAIVALTEEPWAELHTNPVHHHMALRYSEDVSAFESERVETSSSRQCRWSSTLFFRRQINDFRESAAPSSRTLRGCCTTVQSGEARSGSGANSRGPQDFHNNCGSRARARRRARGTLLALPLDRDSRAPRRPQGQRQNRHKWRESRRDDHDLSVAPTFFFLTVLPVWSNLSAFQKVDAARWFASRSAIRPLDGKEVVRVRLPRRGVIVPDRP